jgi:hypothetical protein
MVTNKNSKAVKCPKINLCVLFSNHVAEKEKNGNKKRKGD